MHERLADSDAIDAVSYGCGDDLEAGGVRQRSNIDGKPVRCDDVGDPPTAGCATTAAGAVDDERDVEIIPIRSSVCSRLG
jgi:hypothetical protein